MHKEKIAYLFLCYGIAFSFFYAAYSAFMTPSSWIGFIPDFFSFVSKELLLKVHIGFNFLLGLWLISGKKTVWSAGVAAVALLSIVLFNLGQFDIMFRDLTIACACVALALLNLDK